MNKLLIALMITIGLTACGKADITSVGQHSCIGQTNDWSAHNAKGWRDSGRRTDMDDFKYEIRQDNTIGYSFKMSGFGQGNMYSKTPAVITRNDDKFLEASADYNSDVIIDPTNKQKWIRHTTLSIVINKETGKMVIRLTQDGLNTDLKSNGNSESWEIFAKRCS